MAKDYRIEALLKKHEELIALYMHQKKIEWNLIAVYFAFNMGLAGVVGTLFTSGIIRFGAVVFLCILGFLFSLGGIIQFGRHRKRTLEWIQEGISVENTLEDMFVTSNLFAKCGDLEKEKRVKIQGAMQCLTLVWFLAIIYMIWIANWIDLSCIFP